MKKYISQSLTSYWLAKNLGTMMLQPADSTAGPPFYPPARFFALGEIGGTRH
jgi:hypothetical protein